MNTKTATPTSAATMLAVKNAKRSAEYYRDHYGFKVDFIFEANETGHPCYAVQLLFGTKIIESAKS